MKFSISNIAWTAEHDEAVYKLAQTHGLKGIDVAPGRLWSEGQAEKQVATEFKHQLSEYGLVVAGMQSLLFRSPELTIFQTPEQREATMATLKHRIVQAHELGVTALVFGSPKNRMMGEYTPEKLNTAENFFREVADYAQLQQTVFCLEPNLESDGCDWLFGTGDAIEFVQRVNHPALKINLDTGTMMENGESIECLTPETLKWIGHVHLSVPKLKPFTLSETHQTVLERLSALDYQGWVAIEMVTSETDDSLQLIKETITSLAQHKTN